MPNLTGMKQVNIHPGEICFSSKPIVISTILGSCLAITMYSKSTPYAGMSHCQLPSCRNQENGCLVCTEPYKYVNCTIQKMIEKFKEKKINKSDIEVKVFGGADVLNSLSCSNKIGTIGKQNIIEAFKELSDQNMKVATSDVGGDRGRKILFLTETGEVFLNRLKNNGKN